jgi:hypothetical protein
MAFDPSAPYAAVPVSGASRAFDPTAPFKAYRPAPPEEQKDEYPTLRAIADVPLNFARGAAMSIRNISDAFGANNEFSQNVRGIEDLLGEYMSAQYYKDAKAQREILAKARDQGVLANLQASWEYLKVAPIDTITNLAGASAPYIVASLFGTPVAGAALGAVGGAGTIKGDIYDTVKEQLSANTDLSAEEVEARAQQAQAYNGENLDQILMGAGLGGVAGGLGIESGAAKLLSRTILKKVAEKESVRALAEQTAKKMAETGAKEGFIDVGGASLKKRLAIGAASEAIPESLQEGQEQLAQNVALQREGINVPTMEGVGQAAILGGTLGALVGGPFEGAFGQRPTRIKIGVDGKPEIPGETPPAVPPTGEVPSVEAAPEAPTEPTAETPVAPEEPLAPATPTPQEPAAAPEAPVTPEPAAAPEAPVTPEPTSRPYVIGDPLEGSHTSLPVFSLPKSLAGAKPKFNYKDASFNPVFFNDVDRALYIVAQPQKSSRDAEYRDFLKSVGFEDAEIDALAKDVRKHVKGYAATNYFNSERSGAIPIDFARMLPQYADIVSRATIPEGAAPKAAAPAPTVASAPAPAPAPPIAPTTITFTGRTEQALENMLPGSADIIRQIQRDLFPGSNLTVSTNNQMGSLGRTVGAGDQRTQIVGGVKRGRRIYGGKEVSGSAIELNFTASAKYGQTPKVAFLHTLFHELAHLIEDYWIKTSDQKTRDEIFKQYLKEKNASAFERFTFVREMGYSGRIKQPAAKQSIIKTAGITEEQFNRFMSSSAKTVPSDIATSMSAKGSGSPAGKYYQDFSEWVAEKGARWLAKELEGRTPKTVMEKFQSDVLKSMRDIFSYISNLLGITPTEGAFEKLLNEVYGVETKVPDKGQIRQRRVITPSATPNIISAQAQPPQEGTQVVSKEAKIPPTTTATPPTLSEFATLVTGPTNDSSWFAKTLAEITGQEKIVVNGKVTYEPMFKALLRNTVAANLPFLERPEFRQVGKLLESVQNMQGRLVGMIKFGALAYDPATNEFKFDSTTGGLQELFEEAGVARQGEIQALTVAMREYDLRKANRSGLGFENEKTGRPFTMGELKSIIDNADPQLKKIAEKYRYFNSKMIKFALDTGIITKEQSEAFLSMMYTPFYRKQEEGLQKDGNLVLSPDIDAAINDPQSIKDFSPKLKSGKLRLDPDFYANVLRNYSAIVTMGLKNVAYSNVAKVGEEYIAKTKDRSLMEPVGKGGGDGVITYRVAGGEKHFRVNDVPMFQALASLSPKQLQGWMKFFTRLTELLRLGITSMPGFQIANMYRGLIDTYIKTGMPFFELATETFKLMGSGFYQTVKEGFLDNPSYRAIIAQQGFGGYNIGSRSKDQAEYMLRQYALKAGTPTYKQRAMAIIDRLEEIGELSEMAPRIAYYNWLTKSKDKGGSGMAPADAAYEAVNLVNFSRSGTGRGVFGSAIAFLIPLVPFLNARVQGLYRLIEPNTAGGANKDVVAKFGGAVGITNAIVARGALLLMFELALQAMYGDDEWYDKLSVQDKVSNNYVKVGDTIIALPRPFELGSLFGAVPSLVIDAARKKESKELVEGLTHILSTTFSFNAIPQAVKPLVDVYYANRDSFTGQQIETISEQKRPENERVDEYTSEVAKLVAKGVPYLSPKQADALLRGYLGTFATVMTGTIDGFLSGGGTRPEGYFGDPTSAKGMLANAAGLNRFLKTERTIRNDYVSKFYDVKRTVEEITTSMKDAADARDFDLVKQKIADDPRAGALGKVLNAVERDINEINKKMKSIRNNPNLPAEKKTEYLNVLRDRKAILSERAYRVAKEVGYN